MKVAFKNFWETFSPKWFIDHHFRTIAKEYDITHDQNDPDVEICCSFGKDEPNRNVMNVFWSMESYWTPESLPVHQHDYVFYFFPEKYFDPSKYCRINMTPPSMVGPRKDYSKIEKTKFCHFLYRHEVPFRNDFFSRLNAVKHVDSPGLCMNNMPPIGGYSDPLKSRKASSWISDKMKFIKPYKFAIAFENHEVPGYTTEKIIQPLNVGSIPIYWGNPDIVEDFDPNSFVSYYDFESEEALIERVMEIDADDDLFTEIQQRPCAHSHRENVVLERWKKIFDEAQ
jgi:hypothetical protein